MPGVGIRIAARLLTGVSGKNFETVGHLAYYAGLVPVIGRSGSSIRGEHPPRRGNKILKRALFLSTFAALHDPLTCAHSDRKIARGERHNQALVDSPDDAAPSSMPCAATTPSIKPTTNSPPKETQERPRPN
jgi:transposase